MGEGMNSLEPKTIGQIFKETVAEFPDRNSLGYKDGEEWKYIKFPQYYDMCIAAAKSFIKVSICIKTQCVYHVSLS